MKKTTLKSIILMRQLGLVVTILISSFLNGNVLAQSTTYNTQINNPNSSVNIDANNSNNNIQINSLNPVFTTEYKDKLLLTIKQIERDSNFQNGVKYFKMKLVSNSNGYKALVDFAKYLTSKGYIDIYNGGNDIVGFRTPVNDVKFNLSKADSTINIVIGHL